MLARHDIGDHRRKAELSPQRLRAVLAGAVRAYVQHCRIDANRRSLARIVQSGAALMEQTDLRGFDLYGKRINKCIRIKIEHWR